MSKILTTPLKISLSLKRPLQMSMFVENTFTIECFLVLWPLTSIVFQWFLSQPMVSNGRQWSGTIGGTMEWFHGLIQLYCVGFNQCVKLNTLCWITQFFEINFAHSSSSHVNFEKFTLSWQILHYAVRYVSDKFQFWCRAICFLDHLKKCCSWCVLVWLLAVSLWIGQIELTMCFRNQFFQPT